EQSPLFTLKTRTDSHGLALIEKADALKGLNELSLSVKAQDSKGAIGATSESLPVSSDDALRLKTARTLFHQGEPLRVEVQSSVPEIPRLIIELFTEGRLIRSQIVSVHNGLANGTFLPGSDLQGRVTIHAYDADEDTDSYWRRDRSVTRNVLYPKRRTLAVSA